MKKNNIFQYKNYWHFLFWLISFYVLLRFFAYDQEYSTTDILYTLLFHLSLVITVYLNLEFLIPRHLRKGQYVVYAILMIPLLGFGSFLNILTFDYFADWILPGYYFISYYEFKHIIQFMIVYVLLTSLLKLSKGWFQLRQAENQLDKIKKEKLQTELLALRTQINPHFLFNSLNSIYALSLEQTKKAPEIILKLSESLRYMLYEATDDFVPLEKELQYLENFIELQKLRVEDHPDFKIQFALEGKITDQKIAPLILIPFVENGFKYGIKGNPDQAYILIRLKIEEGQIDFRVENNKGQLDEIENNPYSGIGLKNTKRQLDLLYPEKYVLEIEDLEDRFIVHLKIALS
ncbi:MAG: sensor histidine kinase [Saprospiraceae bacterium]